MSTDAAPEPAPRWHPAVRVAFRFALAYGVLFGLDLVLELAPKGAWLAEHYRSVWDPIIRGVGDLLGVTARRHPTGSGDTMYDWVRFATFLGLAAIAAAVWSALDRRRLAYPRLFELSRVGARALLGITIVSYGLAKVFGVQFSPPMGEDLLRPYGQSSPMGLLWTFMGYSYAYTLFTGLVECLGAVLLVWRRTTLLGALVLVAAMTNVLALDLCYDVPVKLYAAHWLALAGFLVVPDGRRLIDFFVLHRPVAPRPPPTRSPIAWQRRARLAAKLVVIAWILYQQLDEKIDVYQRWGPGAPVPARAGIYQVERFAIGGVERPPLATDPDRWQRITLARFGLAIVTYMNDEQQYFRFVDDSAAHTLTLRPGGGAAPIVVHYRDDGPGQLELAFDGEGGAVAVHIRLAPTRSFPLYQHGFRWVNESSNIQ